MNQKNVCLDSFFGKLNCSCLWSECSNSIGTQEFELWLRQKLPAFFLGLQGAGMLVRPCVWERDASQQRCVSVPGHGLPADTGRTAARGVPAGCRCLWRAPVLICMGGLTRWSTKWYSFRHFFNTFFYFCNIKLVLA